VQVDRYLGTVEPHAPSTEQSLSLFSFYDPSYTEESAIRQNRKKLPKSLESSREIVLSPPPLIQELVNEAGDMLHAYLAQMGIPTASWNLPRERAFGVALYAAVMLTDQKFLQLRSIVSRFHKDVAERLRAARHAKKNDDPALAAAFTVLFVGPLFEQAKQLNEVYAVHVLFASSLSDVRAKALVKPSLKSSPTKVRHRCDLPLSPCCDCRYFISYEDPSPTCC
jgi:hypothetical protein